MTHSLSYTPDENFPRFLAALRQKETREWNWLIAEFRKRLLPFLRKRTQSYPAGALLSREQFLEEVTEETLLQFYRLFAEGNFASYENLEATVITTAGYKLKEGFARLRREQRMYFTDGEALNVMREKISGAEAAAEAAEAERILEVKAKLNALEKSEKDLLTRYFSGEELRDIAEDFNISPAACRKRKQRIVEKLKTLVLKTFTLLILWMI